MFKKKNYVGHQAPRGTFFSSTERKFITKNELILNKKYFLYEVLYCFISLWYISAPHIYLATHTKSYAILLSGKYLFLQLSTDYLPFFKRFSIARQKPFYCASMLNRAYLARPNYPRCVRLIAIFVDIVYVYNMSCICVWFSPHH